MSEEEVKKIGGLRFEVFTHNPWSAPSDVIKVKWRLVGADGVVCMSPFAFDTEKEARSHISANRGRLKAAGRSKVFTIDD